jgi:hypothetical protein
LAERGDAAIVLGAGFAGLGTAAALQGRGIATRVLERSDAVGASWRGRYASLRLNTLRWMSTLPGYRLPRRYGRWPGRDQLVEYLEEYARQMRLQVELGTEAQRIDRAGRGWAVETSDGRMEAPIVVVATGFDREPFLPPWPGMDTFTGEILHASDYREPAPYRGRDVLVVSAGNTGSEVAYELVRNGAARVRTAMRSSPNIAMREVLGVPEPLLAATLDPLPLPLADRFAAIFQRVTIGDLSEYGIPAPTHGLATNVQTRQVSPMIDGGFVSAVKSGEIAIVGAVEGFDGPDVLLAGGDRVQPEVVIAATGYRRGLEELVGHLGVLDPAGSPTYNGVPADPRTPGLYFNGYRTLLSGQLRLMRMQARRIARHAARGA